MLLRALAAEAHAGEEGAASTSTSISIGISIATGHINVRRPRSRPLPALMHHLQVRAFGTGSQPAVKVGLSVHM